MTYLDIILPLPIEGTFTYILPNELKEKCLIGQRVAVSFANKQYSGIVYRIHSTPPAQDFKLKSIIDILDSQPILTQDQLRLWQWMSEYYMCPVGDIYKAALPAGLRPAAETHLAVNKEFPNLLMLTPLQLNIYELLQAGKAHDVAGLSKLIKDSKLMKSIKELISCQAVCVEEKLETRYKPKNEIHVRLSLTYQNHEALHSLTESLKATPKRLQLLQGYIELSGITAALQAGNQQLIHEVEKKQLLEHTGISIAVITGMKDKGILEFYDFKTSRLRTHPSDNISTQLQPLSQQQHKAYESILEGFSKKQVCLLHGVTSSGKTEIYIHLIQQVLQQGGQVLYLLPEIALTTQITERLRKVFHNDMGVYHSKFPDNERAEIWLKQLSQTPYKLILGVRSSVFLPFSNLHLIIIDEEHENSYKQEEPSPRYHARDTAIMMAHQAGAHVLLGSATPSIESFWNAQTGKYAFTSLTTRYGGMQMPHIEVADIKELMRTKQMRMPFSPRLEDEMRNALKEGRQVILFQNRRGYAPVTSCHQCGWTPSCQCCDVSLTYHQETHQMVCHYCGRTYPIPSICPACGETDLRPHGYGTEKIEEEVHRLFPTVRTSRLDLDTTRNLGAYEAIIHDFSTGNSDILIGTQMVSKGLDFERVQVVGILDADTMLNRPDFRSHEHTFQQLAQVAGRAGRKDRQGHVILQTRQADHPIIAQVLSNDYQAMYQTQIEERQLFRYPPFYRIINITLRNKSEALTKQAAEKLASQLSTYLGDRILGPGKPAVSRQHNLFIRSIVIKAERGISGTHLRAILHESVKKLHQEPHLSSIQIYFDVDPV